MQPLSPSCPRELWDAHKPRLEVASPPDPSPARWGTFVPRSVSARTGRVSLRTTAN